MWQLDYQSLKDFLSRMEKENKPVFYKYIETIDPFFKGKTSYGTCLQDDSLIVDLSFYCFENSWMISDALKNMMADKLNKLILIKHSFIMSSHLLVNFPLMPRWLVLILDFLKEESDFSMKLYDYCNYLLIYYGSEMPFVQYASSQNENSSDFAENAVDGYEDTIWHTQWEGRMARHPHEIQIDLKKRMKFKGFSYLPRQDGSENGTIKEYEFYVSNDGKNWGNPVSKGSFDSLARAKMEQRILFNEPVKARYFRLVALSEINGGPWASAAEIGVIPVGEDTNE